MNVAFAHAGGTNLHESRFLPQLVQRSAAAISHAGLEAANELINIGRKGTAVGHPADDTLWNQLVVFSLFTLIIAALAALFHRLNRAHAPIQFVAAALKEDHLPRALFGTGQKHPDHNTMCTGADGLGDITGETNTAIGD